MACLDWRVPACVLLLFVTLSCVPLINGLTDLGDVSAINQLYASLGSPPFPDWDPAQGDPCGPPVWQGVECVISRVTGLILGGANLGGVLPDDLTSFSSIMTINLSSNHIGGSIPSNLPTTLLQLDLSNNQFMGSIPDTISTLSSLNNLFLNCNQMTGPIPDAFEHWTSLTTMDLSGNNLSGNLPPSMGNLSALTTLHIQNNQLSGMLDVLQNIPLTDLNVENNFFSGPIPANMQTIPNFRRDGNPFNTSILPSPPAPAPVLPPSEGPLPDAAPGVVGPSQSPLQEPGTKDKKKNATHMGTWIVIAGLLVLIVLALGVCISIPRSCMSEKTSKKLEVEKLGGQKQDQSPQSGSYQVHKGTQAVSNELQQTVKLEKDHRIDIPPSSLPFPLIPAKRIIADPIFTSLNTMKTSQIVAKFYTIASLQQYTRSFSQENFVGKGTLGTVYRAELPDGTVLAVKKLDRSGNLSDGDFLEIVSSISKLCHPNIVELVGYCLEHGQRLLVYNYCKYGTLNEALHLDDQVKEKLSWNARMRLALQAAKALEYLHEKSQPPVMHRNFKSMNLLLEDDLSLRVSDCGLAPLLPPNSMAELQGMGYGAPELELGNYSCQSDVYSFGVVMLELLTGRKSHDRLRPRGEHYLVRWALSRLHDIDALAKMVDPSLHGAYPSKSLSRLADIISLCIQPEPEFRPPMSEIVQKLVHMISEFKRK